MPTFKFYKEDEQHSSSTDDWEASLISSSKYASPIMESTDDGLYIDELASIFNGDEEERDREMEMEEEGSILASTDKRWILSLKPLLSDLASLYPELLLTKSGSRHLIMRTRECLLLLKTEKQQLDLLTLDNNKLKSIFASLYEIIGSYYSLLSIPNFESQPDLVSLFKNLQSKLTSMQAELRWAKQQIESVAAQQDQRHEEYIRLMNELSEKEAVILALRDSSDPSNVSDSLSKASPSALLEQREPRKNASSGMEAESFDLTEEEWNERNAALERMNASSAALSTSVEMLHNEAEFVLQQTQPGAESMAHLIGVPLASTIERSPNPSDEEIGAQAPLLETAHAGQDSRMPSIQDATQTWEHEDHHECEPIADIESNPSSLASVSSCRLTNTTVLPEWMAKYPDLKHELSALCANEERLQDALNRLQSQYDALMQRQSDIQSENEMLHYQIKSFQLENTLLFEKAQELLMMTFDFKSTQIQLSAVRSVSQGGTVVAANTTGTIAGGAGSSGGGASASLVPAMHAMSVEASTAIHRLGSLLKAATTAPATGPCATTASATSPSTSPALTKPTIESQSVARYVELLKTEFTSTIEALRGNYESALKNETKERVKYQNLYEGLKNKMNRAKSASQEGYRNASTQTFFFDTN